MGGLGGLQGGGARGRVGQGGHCTAGGLEPGGNKVQLCVGLEGLLSTDWRT